MLITTTNDLPGYVIDEVYGEVFGLTVRSRNIGSQIGAGLKSILGGELKGMTKALVDSRNEVIERMVDEAEAKGGNAIVAMRFDTSEMGDDLDGDLRVRHRRASPQGVTATGRVPHRPTAGKTLPAGTGRFSATACNTSEMVPGTGLSAPSAGGERRERRVVQRDAVAPEGVARREQAVAQRAAELVRAFPSARRLSRPGRGAPARCRPSGPRTRGSATASSHRP